MHITRRRGREGVARRAGARRVRVRCLVPISFVVVAVMAGCRASSDRAVPEPYPPTSTVATGETTTATMSAEAAAAWEAYLAFWRAYRSFGSEARAVEPFEKARFDQELGPYLTGVAYTSLLHTMSQGRLRGQFLRGPMPEHDPAPDVVVEGTTATIRDCVLDAGEIYDGRRGVVVNPASGTRRLLEARMELVDGAWRLAQPLQRPDGDVPCAV